MQDSAGLVSVVIPAYNAAGFLGKAVESAMAQSYQKLEIIVVDDGSTDNTGAVARALAARDSRVSVVSHPSRRGVAAARNLGVSQARGEWVAALDADDLWAREKIERQLEAASAGPTGLGLVYTWTRYIDDRDRPLAELAAPWEGDVFVPLVLCNFVGHASAPLIRRTVLEQLGGFDTQFFAQHAQGCEDWDLYLQIARRFEFRVVRDYLVSYRVVAGGMSRQHRVMERSYRLMMKKLASQVRVPSHLLRWSESQFYVYLEAIARANGDATFGRKCWLRSCCVNPVRLLRLGTYQRVWERLPRLGGKSPKPTRRRWDNRPPARLYDWFEARALRRGGAWWQAAAQRT
ncbi:MAG TPA: glycosyltransferase family A protein [Prosthecobacter sp.]|nr:glycosyltransferase family A protein [Prosthecobacter sp.]